MSIYYFIVCDKHMERTPAASKTMFNCCALGDSKDTLLPFIVVHVGCPVRIVMECEDAAYSDRYEDWTKINMEDMVEKERNVILKPPVPNKE